MGMYKANITLMMSSKRKDAIKLSPFLCHIIFKQKLFNPEDSIPEGYSVKLFFDSLIPWQFGEAREVQLAFLHWDKLIFDAIGMDFELHEAGCIGIGRFIEFYEELDK